MFLVVYAVERAAETFWKRDKIKGVLSSPLSLPLLVGTYVLMYLTCLWELTAGVAESFSGWISVVGGVLVLLSTFGRNWAIRTLGPFHSIQIEIRANHELIQSGPYAWVRNPYYLSNVVEAVGLPLVANAFYGGLISLFVYLPVLIVRMVLEERALTKKFGAGFLLYKSRVPRLFPSLGGRRKRPAGPTLDSNPGNSRSDLVETKT